MASDVKIIIEMSKPIGNVGFGCPLILEENATTAREYKEYYNLAAVKTAGYEEDTAVYKTAQLIFMQEHFPEKIAICSTTTAAGVWLAVAGNKSKDWRQLLIVNSGETATDVKGIMTAIEAETTYPKMYYANLDVDDESLEYQKTADKAIQEGKSYYTLSDGTYTLVEQPNVSNINTYYEKAPVYSGIERTVLCFYTPTEDIPVPVAAIAGEVSGLEVGSYTLNNLLVKGVRGLDLANDQLDAIHGKGGITIVISAGDTVVSEGKTAGGSFVDNVDGNDYIRQQLEYKTQKVFNNNLKVPYTNAGIGMLESVAMGVMADAQSKGIVDSYTVKYALREEISEDDRTARKYFGGNITYSMAGAIHEATIYCVCSL